MHYSFVSIILVSYLPIILSYLFPNGLDLTHTKNPTAPQVVIMGDSVFDFTGDISTVLEELSGDRYRDYSVTGARIDAIVQQYDKARSEDSNIRTVLMDGGGNNLLQRNQTNCKDADDSRCVEMIQTISTHVEDALDHMSADNVENVIFLGYYHMKRNLEFLGPAIDAINQANFEKCKNAGLNCYSVDPTEAFEGHPEYLQWDNIHPTNEGSRVLADMIWDVMVQNQIEQD